LIPWAQQHSSNLVDMYPLPLSLWRALIIHPLFALTSWWFFLNLLKDPSLLCRIFFILVVSCLEQITYRNSSSYSHVVGILLALLLPWVTWPQDLQNLVEIHIQQLIEQQCSILVTNSSRLHPHVLCLEWSIQHMQTERWCVWLLQEIIHFFYFGKP
jgi:hypothetical protein